MTPAAYREALTRLGLSQVGAARLFGVNPRTSRRWALGELEVPRAVEIALDLFDRAACLGVTPDDYMEIKEARR